MPISKAHPTGLTKMTVAPAATEDLLTGMRRLRGAFLEAESRSVEGGAPVIDPDQSNAPAFLIDRGYAYSATTLADGRRAITDIHLPGDIVGIEHVMGRPSHAVIAANDLHFRPLSTAVIRHLIADPHVAMSILELAGEAHRRADQHMLGLTRLDAREHLCAFLLGIYERLTRRERITRPTFTLPMTQAEIADHLGLTMVHISRTLRRLREERLVIVNRGVVIILDANGLRDVASGPTNDRIANSNQRQRADAKADVYRTRETSLPD